LQSELRSIVVRSAVLGWLCVSAAPGFAAPQTTKTPGQGSAPQAASQISSNGETPPPVVTVPTGVSGMQGLRVSDIQLRGEVQFPPERLNELLAQKVDQPLDKSKVRQSIQALFATGRFANIQVEADRNQRNEVRLVFVGEENFFVGFITVDGAPNPPKPNQLVNASKLQLGELFTPEKVEDAIARIKRVMEDNGYYQSTITAEKVPHSETQQMDVTFHMVAGPPARVGKVEVQGDPGYATAEIQETARIHAGDKVTAKRLTGALQRLRKKYQKVGRLEAQVATTKRTYHPENNTLDYVFNLVRGASIDVHLEGAKMRSGRVKKYVPVYEENAVDDDLLNEGTRNIRDYFQTQGYFDARVTWKQEHDPKQDHRHVIYHVDLGKRHKLIGVVLEGNKYFDDDLLRERMLIQTAGTLLSHGRFSESIMTRDQESIENVYKANGFRDVKAKAEAQDDYNGVVGHMRVVFHITEGTQTRVAELKLEGNTSVTDDKLIEAGLINTVAGQPFSEFNMASDREALLSYYFNIGFPDVRVETFSQPAATPDLMNVTYHITEGDRVFVDKVLMSGLEKTKEFVAHREFRLWDGDTLSQVSMLSTQRRLYDLGIFNQVDMAVQNPEGNAPSKNLLVQFEEAKRWTFSYGFGFEVQTGGESQACPGDSKDPRVIACRKQFEQLNGAGKPTASPRVSLDVTRINFRGRNHTLVFKGTLGRLQKRALAGYEAPRFFDHETLKLTITAFYDNSRDIRTFTSERIEGSAQIDQTLSRISTLLYRFTYRRVKADPATLLLSVEQVPLLSKPVRVGMPSLTYIRDKRDNPIETFKGNYTTVDFGTASYVFGSEANFNRLLLQNSTYHTFGKKKYVFARSTRIGVAQPYGRSTIIPLPERFFAGGSNSHRGFDLNGAGPRDAATGSPLGGNALFLNSIELRLPPPTLPFLENNLGFVIFEDAGNVLAQPGDLFRSIGRIAQPHKDQCRLAATDPTAKCDFNYLSHAIGAGIRYKTPIGPVRVDVGYNLNPTLFPRQDLTDFRTINRLNFYFSIGQTF
jgi:outer membrane protein insertion porin family